MLPSRPTSLIDGGRQPVGFGGWQAADWIISITKVGTT